MATKPSAPSSGVPPKPLVSSSTRRLVDAKTPATTVGAAMQSGVVVDREYEHGISVQKITDYGNYKPRVITISKDRFAIFCTHQKIEKGGVTGAVSTIARKLPLPLVTRKGVRGLTRNLRDSYVRHVDVADIDYVCTGTVSTRKLEQTRTKNRLKGADSKIDVLKQEIVTIGHHGDQTLDFLVADERDRRQLIAIIKNMCATFYEAQKFVSHEDLLLRYIWYDVDANRDGLIGEKEFVKIMARINFNVASPSTEFRAFVQERNLKKAISLADVHALLRKLKNQQGIGSSSMANAIWDNLFGSTNVVDAETFMTKFIHGVQGETYKSLSVVKELVSTINSMEIDHVEGETENLITDEQISRPCFEAFLYHEINDAYDPRLVEFEKKVSLNRPMSHYFINTSHNTYLTGDQLQSSSSVEMYAKALRRGCKCLELDCWDGEKGINGQDPNPVVFHGHTFTSKILFFDIMQVVKNYLDDNPATYPIILSLENHCSHPFQSAIAKALTDTFGDKLYIPPEKMSGDLPSPESLRGMVVIKGKRPPESEDNPADIVYDEDVDQYDEANREGEVSSRKLPGKADSPTAKPEKPPKVVKELARLTLFHGTKFKEFEKSIEEPPSHMHSIGETKITKILSKTPKNASLWRKYNIHHMTRTYPAGARVDSSNYNPILAWSVGSQLVALNFQTNDAPLILNDGLFRQNSQCGYLPKPSEYLNEDPPPTVDRSKPALQLKIRVLSGSCLPKPMGAKSGETIDPYVQVTLHDVTRSNDGGLTVTQTNHNTSTVNDNGFCPVWNETTAKEFTVYSPEIAMVQFVLREADIGLDDHVAFAAIPISCLRQGYRSIQLHDSHNTRTGAFSYASLLVEIQITKL